MRRTVLVVICLGLLAAVGAVFTRVIAARVPEQRAKLEKLITDRTGLQVRFDNVHFSWGLDGTSAVFQRVELTDPVRGRVRVVAPELRVEFDTWDFLRHQQFTLGHVTLSSPDIEIVGDAEAAPSTAAARHAPPASERMIDSLRNQDEAALVRRFTNWAELMPIGRVEVEGARVHLLRGGDRARLHSFTLSQADVSRGEHTLNAFGTLLLSQDVGQSLFMSVKLRDLGAPEGVAGDVRLIARRVMLEKLGFDVARGRGTLDAKVEFRKGLVYTAQAQASARELQVTPGKGFDHFTVNAALRRARNDVLLEFNDLQVTRGARLERAPRLTARLVFAPGSVRVDQVTAQAERVPYMAAELISAAFALQLEPHLVGLPRDWSPRAGELRAVSFDSRHGSFHAQVSNTELVRNDGARVSQLAGSLALADGAIEFAFDPAQDVMASLPETPDARALRLGGSLVLRADADRPQWQFEKLEVSDGKGSLLADGGWGGARAASLLSIEAREVDRALLGDVAALLSLQNEVPRLADIGEGRIVAGKLQLAPVAASGEGVVNWARSRGSLTLAGLSSAGEDMPRLVDAAGKLEFSRTGAQLRLTGGRIDDLEVTGARIDWPRQGTPRLRASLQGELQSPMMRDLLREQGLAQLTGAVALEADARGEQALGDPRLWRVTARVSNASMPLAADLPPATALTGTVRFADQQLRGLALEGKWLEGPLKIESRRAAAPGDFTASISGTAEAAPLLRLMGQADVADLVNGQVAWNGTLKRLLGSAEPDAWQLSLNSNLAGLESRLPEPFDKPRGRAVNIHAELRLDANGLREFDLESGRDAIHGRVKEGVTTASFDVQGVAGELLGGPGTGADSRLELQRLELRRSPVVLAAAGALLPQDGELVVQVADLRHRERGLGALRADLGRHDSGLEFTLESADGAPHDLSGSGSCTARAECRMEFTFGSRQPGALLALDELPSEWPTRSLRASGELSWRSDVSGELLASLAGQFELEALGAENRHQLTASATLSDGLVTLANVQGSGPDPDEIFHGSGRIALLARTYDFTVDYERVSLAASAVPAPARESLSRAWSVLRGSVARNGSTETAPPRRVQWHGSWD